MSNIVIHKQKDSLYEKATYLFFNISIPFQEQRLAQPTFGSAIHAVIGLDNSQIVADSQH